MELQLPLSVDTIGLALLSAQEVFETAANLDLLAVDSVFAKFHAESPQPALAYGVVSSGRLVHSVGFGGLTVDGPLPNADSVFRIASITKSFTAVCLLGLRDEGALNLDDPVSRYVPELAELAGPTADSPPLTLRSLLTMSGGFPTDDPWGDRQLALSRPAFDQLLRSGFRFAWAPETAFEYSNLGYAILGRVIAAVTGQDYRRAVESRVLEPLHMTSTAFTPDAVPAADLAVGYRELDGAWLEVPFAAHGEFASMGGLFSSLRDLARWVGEFTDAFPPRDEEEGNHVLSRATRREMQQAHRLIPPALSFASVDGAPSLLAGGYGFGLFVEHDLRWGEIVSHPGGLPGFGSAMRWHPASGLGVVVLANATYSPASKVAAKALDVILTAEASVAPVSPWPETEAAHADVLRLLDHWQPDLVGRIFAENVELDEPLVRRQAEIERIRAQLGSLSPDLSSPAEVTSPAGIAWWMRGEHGRVKVKISLNPQKPPAIQTLEFTVVPNPSVELERAATEVAEALAMEMPDWSSLSLTLEPGQDVTIYNRMLRAAAMRAGRCQLGDVIAGDGARTATFRLTGERCDLDLTVETDPKAKTVTGMSLVPTILG